jgi:hypothetical protein
MDGPRGITGLRPWALIGAYLLLAQATMMARGSAWASGTGDAPGPESVREDRDAEVRVAQAPAPRAQPRAPTVPPRIIRPSPPRPTQPELALGSTPAATTGPSPVARPGLAGLEAFPLVGVPQMLGDQAPIFGSPRAAAGSGSNVVRLPWVRGYKMADNQSPLPLDRVFATFYYYDDINVGNARPPGATIRDVKVYREFFGFEKTFLDGWASLGLRLPLNSISARGNAGGTSTALGDLTIFGKYALWMDPVRGVFSLGMAVTPPTGPAAFAGAEFTRARNPTYLQPFIGILRPMGRWYVQGFSGINVPTDSHVVTMFYNDIGIGYFLQAGSAEALVSAVVPSMEVHVNTPLNHRGGFSDVRDPGATIDSVNLTFGLSTVLRRRTVLSAGVVTPVTGPRPFDIEAIVTLNTAFGATRRGRLPGTVPPPSLGN